MLLSWLVFVPHPLREYGLRWLTFRHFAEPTATDGDPTAADRYRRVPWFHIMEWQKP